MIQIRPTLRFTSVLEENIIHPKPGASHVPGDRRVRFIIDERTAKVAAVDGAVIAKAVIGIAFIEIRQETGGQALIHFNISGRPIDPH